MLPKTFDEWKNCIVNDCKIKLTKAFAQRRLAVYQDKNNRETQQFTALYGESHLENVIHWLQRV